VASVPCCFRAPQKICPVAQGPHRWRICAYPNSWLAFILFEWWGKEGQERCNDLLTSTSENFDSIWQQSNPVSNLEASPSLGRCRCRQVNTSDTATCGLGHNRAPAASQLQTRRPSSWKSELEKFGLDLEIKLAKGMKKKKNASRPARIFGRICHWKKVFGCEFCRSLSVWQTGPNSLF